jgi:hypothetical protein
MLHERLGSLAHWKDFPSRLAEETGAGVFACSRHGHGKSDALTGPRAVSWMHHEAQIVVPEILRKAEIERPILLVFVEEISVSSIAKARMRYQETDMPRRLGRYHANVNSLFPGWNNSWLDPNFRNWNIESYLDLIRCPILVLQGAQDEYGTLKQVAARPLSAISRFLVNFVGK